jgi:methionine-rich copper-binding protein CopC
MRSLIRLCAVFLFAVNFFIVPSALAHTELVSANPAKDSVVKELPTDVTLTFSEKLLIVGIENPNKVEVFDSSGQLLSGASVVNGALITAPTGINGNGVYTVKYHVAADDGHVVEGSYEFTVEADMAIASPMPISAPTNEKEDGPNLLVRIVVMAVIGLVALTLLRRARSSGE